MRALYLSFIIALFLSNPLLARAQEERFQTAVGLVVHKSVVGDQSQIQHINFFCTGALIQANVILTAAHCLKNADSVSVSLGEVITFRRRDTILSTKFLSHPDYESSNHVTDFGLIFLPFNVQSTLAFPMLTSFSSRLPTDYIRFGYGGRNSENRRFRAEMDFEFKNSAGFVLSTDPTGVPGDSGGPVYVESGKKLLLIGLHTGREEDPETHQLKDRSFMTPLNPSVIQWIQTSINDNH